MAVLAFVSETEQVDDVVTWAARFADALGSDLQILCWSYSPIAENTPGEEDGESSDQLTRYVRRWISTAGHDESHLPLAADRVRVMAVRQPDSVAAAIEHIRRYDNEMLVAWTSDPDGVNTRTDRKNPLLRRSPCDTVILMRGRDSNQPVTRIYVGTENSSSDALAAKLAAKLSQRENLQVTVVRAEDDPGRNALEVGRRELRDLMKDAGIRRTDSIRLKVYRVEEEKQIIRSAGEADLVLVGANSDWSLQQLKTGTSRPALAVVKRAPPLRKPGLRWLGSLLVPLTPASYGDLVRGLRRGSKISEEFLVMLGLAAAIASLGLLQDSPAVVIGSMLLAPLMTPMIGCGLATAQANPTLGRSALLTIFVGFLLTLLISCVVGLVTPGNELTMQVMSRANPNILDLLVALFSGAAAAYALARPNVVAALAGVAIATALVPPLCSAGISVSYLEFESAVGAGILFVTNVVAIILSAALTFRLLGVTAQQTTAWQRNWVVRVVGILGIAVIALAFPLEQSLEDSLRQGRPSHRTFPLTKAVHDAVVEEVEKSAGVNLIAGGRPASEFDSADVILILSAHEEIDQSLGDRLIEITRQKMNDPTLNVEVHCLQDYWYRSSLNGSDAEQRSESGLLLNSD